MAKATQTRSSHRSRPPRITIHPNILATRTHAHTHTHTDRQTAGQHKLLTPTKHNYNNKASHRSTSQYKPTATRPLNTRFINKSFLPRITRNYSAPQNWTRQSAANHGAARRGEYFRNCWVLRNGPISGRTRLPDWGYAVANWTTFAGAVISNACRCSDN